MIEKIEQAYIRMGERCDAECQNDASQNDASLLDAVESDEVTGNILPIQEKS